VRVTLEIAVSTPDEAVGAARAGADRLELCAALEVGGVTPSLGVFARVRELVAVPVWVLLRPRPGGFRYTRDEVAAMLCDAAAFLAAGADGLVFGALDEIGNIADETCRRVADFAQGCVAFHRAFDFTADPRTALDQLTELGFARVLTSGAKPTAAEGTVALAELVSLAAGRIAVMPGGGVRPDNVARLVRATGCAEVHAAARSSATDPTLLRNLNLAVAMGAPAGYSAATDPDLVAGLRTELDQLGRL
jgi:copper homeostasis protein